MITNPEPLFSAPHIYTIDSAYYLEDVLNPYTRKTIIKKIEAKLAQHQFDAIAFRGLSGALVAPIVALHMDKTLLCIRKEESSHSDSNVEGDIAARSYIILDDFVCSGSTVKAIQEAVTKVAPQAKCLGIYQYRWDSFLTNEEFDLYCQGE
jgi:adenine/guanine phosphoribosyltransferase-like PRPP-binding protein